MGLDRVEQSRYSAINMLQCMYSKGNKLPKKFAKCFENLSELKELFEEKFKNDFVIILRLATMKCLTACSSQYPVSDTRI